ncbi:MAG: peptide MFS transporter [Gemmatimonadetes bacterium]|nr:peptide MFS transporter [Gemmatimonadota bacterium]MCY3677225.1 peptide MFS transporter [Gemmatimonadota bacterium]MYA44430.1 peptide MFS transporter [Gemmatimonadota bacterium]MYE94810.1 peptide MFS transporter [Gemmatimonadota bacterium]MYJ09943.1 peptide MFS transporter [Gemmatimonadota bacterium]
MTTATRARHPRGLMTLFFTEMWERFSYYGMRALLILYLAETTIGQNPGMGLDVATAGAIYGLYTGLVYLLGLPGGWVADQLWGQRKAVFVGGCIIAAGHFSMAVPNDFNFFLGLILIVIGTGLLKPNVSSVVADLYPEGGARRDAGFSIFYMGINVGAFAGPLICGWLGQDYNWHWGFSAAGFGMVLGLIQFRLGYGRLGDAGVLRSERTPQEIASLSRRFFGGCAALALALVAFGVLVSRGSIPVTLTQIAGGLAWVIGGVVLVYFVYLMFFGGHDVVERKKIAAIFWFALLAVIFWSGFEQAGSSLNLFAENYTDRTIGSWSYPASWLQSVNAFFIVCLAPVFGWLWVWLANRNANPSTAVKFALGLLGLAAGFFVIAWGAANATPDSPVSASWLIVMYFLHTVGELALSPVGLSAVTKLAPPNRISQMMGLWFVATSLGNVVAGLVAGRLEALEPSPLFFAVTTIIGSAGFVALLASPLIKRLMGDVK